MLLDHEADVDPTTGIRCESDDVSEAGEVVRCANLADWWYESVISESPLTAVCRTHKEAIVKSCPTSHGRFFPIT